MSIVCNLVQFAREHSTFQPGSMPQISLSDLKFHTSAKADLKKAASDNDAASFQKKLLKQWGKLKDPLFPGGNSRRLCCTIGIEALLGKDDDRLFRRALRIDSVTSKADIKKALESLVSDVAAAAAQNSLTSEFSMLLAMELLATDGDRFAPEQFRDTVLAVLAFDPDAGDSSELQKVLPNFQNDTESKSSAEDRSELQLVRAIVRFAEIPFARSVLFDCLEEASKSRDEAVETLAQAVEASTDNDGTVHTRLTQAPERWLSPIIRMSALGGQSEPKWAKAKTIKRWISALEFFAALTVHEGWLQKIEGGESIADESDIKEASARDHELQPVDYLSAALGALQMQASKKKDKKSVRNLLKESSLADVVAALSESDGKARKKPGPEMDWYTPSTQSDWAASALLRTGFEVDANSVLIDWDRPQVRLFLSTFGASVIGGDWGTEIQINGEDVEQAGDWTCTCWFQDDEVAFAELERGSVGGTRHVRHVMLHLQDHFAVLAESVTTANEADQVVVRTSLPIASCVECERATVTRELFLSTPGPRCRVIPAWLPDDRIQSADGDCRIENGILHSAAVGAGGVFLPLLIDWAPQNRKREADWTALTVSEDGKILTGHSAAAVRTRIGRQQILLYRSLRAGETLRAVLGHHTANETVYGKFNNEGEVEPLVLVEANAEG